MFGNLSLKFREHEIKYPEITIEGKCVTNRWLMVLLKSRATSPDVLAPGLPTKLSDDVR